MKQRKLGVILSYISELIQIIVGLVYMPIMIRLLGQSEYGLYQLVYSVIMYLNLFNIGFNSSYIRFYSRYKVKNDKSGIAKLNGMFMIIFTIIAILASICGIILVINTPIVFGNKLTTQELSKARILMIIMTINLAITFISSVYSCIITAHEQFVFQKLVIIFRNIFNPLISLPLLILGYGSIGMVLVTTIVYMLSLTANYIFCKKKLKIEFDYQKFDWKLFKEMWNFTFFIFLNKIVDQVNWSVDKFLIGRMIGTLSVAVYGVASQINTMFISFSSSICNVFTPTVNLMVAKNKKNKKNLNNLMIKVGRIQFIILMLVLSGFLFFGKEFIKIWAGREYTEGYYVALILISSVFIPLIQNLGIDIQRAMNKHQVRSIVYIIVAFLNIIISIPLIKHFGIIGAAIGTAIGLVGGNTIFINIYYQKALKLDMILFWKKIISFAPAIIIPILSGFIINNVLMLHGIMGLLAKITIYTIIYILSMWYIGMNEYEKGLAKNIASKIKKTHK